MPEPRVVLIQDTREQRGWSDLFESTCSVETLAVGDYSVAGLTHLVAVERKSLPDLLQSLTHERSRFERELARARAYHRFYVIVEASAPDILHGRFGQYGSRVNPNSIWESIATFSNRYAPFVFSGDRSTGAKLCESLLLKFAREYYRTIERMERATAAMEQRPDSMREAQGF
jgi:DNA excision repair protein ERCC-4